MKDEYPGRDKTAALEEAIRREEKPRLRHLFRLFGYVFSSAKFMCTLFLCLMILLSLLRPVLAFVWGRYVDAANSFTPNQSVLSMIALLVAYYLLNFLIDLLNRYLQAWEQIERLDVVQMNRFQELLDSRMYTKLAALPSEDFEVPAINDRIERVFKFTQDGWSGLNRELMIRGYSIVANVVSVLSIAASLYIYEPMLAWIVLIAPLPTLYTAYIGKKLEFKFVRDNAKDRREADYFEKLMLGPASKEMKALGLYDFFYGKWKARIDAYILKERKTQVRSLLLGMLGSLIGNIASIAATVLAIVLMTMGRLTLGALGAVMSLVATLVNSTSELFGSIGAFLSKKNEAAQFFDLVDLPEQTADGERIDGIESVEARGLCYRYPLTDKYVLEDVDLSIRKGERLALVGENGAGKTTFVRLLCGTLSPSAGELSVNGLAACGIAPESRYAGMASVLQVPAKYTTFTVGENVALGDTAAPLDEERIAVALEAAGFADADAGALLGKDIGGTDLSGGQWQKLAIARAHYRGRDFIILDEPTGNLDPLAEAEVFQKYLELAAGKTLIMVTHRISVAALADRIIVFAGGRVAEDGTHGELLAAGGEYARLYSEQAKWYSSR